MAVYYLRIGRVAPMILAHYLHDAIQFVIIILLIWAGTIQLWRQAVVAALFLAGIAI
jgi:hypothetical protein